MLHFTGSGFFLVFPRLLFGFHQARGIGVFFFAGGWRRRGPGRSQWSLRSGNSIVQPPSRATLPAVFKTASLCSTFSSASRCSVTSITITSRGKALGYMRQAPLDDPYLHTKQELLDQIAICLAGASAEEVFFGSRSTGSVGDLQQAMRIAEQLVASGMSSLGVVDMDVISSKVLHDEMQAIVKEQELYVSRQVEACREQIHEVACHLLEREKLSGDEFRALIGPLTPVSVCGVDS